jgi:hypothetical protein
MARERTPEGKRVVIPVRVSEPKAAAIDAARGETPRSVWVEAAIDACLAGGPRPLRTTSKGREKVTLTERATFGDPEPERTPKNCKHPRVHGKGVCPDCHGWVASNR